MQQLAHLDQQLMTLLTHVGEVDTPLLEHLLTQREQVLQQLQADPTRLEKVQWQAAIDRTVQLMAHVQHHREQSAQHMQRLVHGQRSLQMYNKFR